jgi:hypothetical protein
MLLKAIVTRFIEQLRISSSDAGRRRGGGLVEITELFDALKPAGHIGRVSHQQQRHAMLRTGFADQFQNHVLISHIDIRRRLVGQQKRRAVGQRSGDGYSLLLADRQLARPMAQAVAQADSAEQLAGTGAIGALAGKTHSQQNILERGERRQQIERLEDKTDPLGAETITGRFRQDGNVVTVYDYRTAVGRADPRDDVQQGATALPLEPSIPAQRRPARTVRR